MHHSFHWQYISRKTEWWMSGYLSLESLFFSSAPFLKMVGKRNSGTGLAQKVSLALFLDLNIKNFKVKITPYYLSLYQILQCFEKASTVFSKNQKAHVNHFWRHRKEQFKGGPLPGKESLMCRQHVTMSYKHATCYSVNWITTWHLTLICILFSFQGAHVYVLRSS